MFANIKTAIFDQIYQLFCNKITKVFCKKQSLSIFANHTDGRNEIAMSLYAKN